MLRLTCYYFINIFLAVHLKNADVSTVPIIDVSFDHRNFSCRLLYLATVVFTNIMFYQSLVVELSNNRLPFINPCLSVKLIVKNINET